MVVWEIIAIYSGLLKNNKIIGKINRGKSETKKMPQCRNQGLERNVIILGILLNNFKL